MAKLNIYIEREDNKNTCSKPILSPSHATGLHVNDSSDSDCKVPKTVRPSCYSNKAGFSVNKRNRDNSFSSILTKPKFNRTKMWIRQVIKISHSIIQIMESLEKLLKKNSPITFVTPLELENQRKYWEDFSYHARKTLLSLKRDVNILSLKISSPLNRLPDSLLQLLSSACRSCLHLLKGLENFPEEIKLGRKGNSLYCETLVLSQQVLLILAMGGIALPVRASSHLKNARDASQGAEESESDVSEIMTSELDSEALLLVIPKTIKKKLTHLVQSKISNVNRFKKTKTCLKIIAPLKKIETEGSPSTNIKTLSSHPMKKKLGEGRTIHFIHDSLSPKLCKEATTLIKSEKEGDKLKKTITQAGEVARSTSIYGVSEKMADAVFERILPFVKSNTCKISSEEIPQRTFQNNMEMYLEVQKKIDELKERLGRLEIAADRQAQFVTRLSARQSDCHREETRNTMDLEKAIRQATAKLRTAVKADCSLPDLPAGSINDAMRDLRHTSVIGVTPCEVLLTRNSSQTLLSVQDHVRSQKLEFWCSLIDNQYIVPPDHEHTENTRKKNDAKEVITLIPTNIPISSTTQKQD